MSNRKIEIFDGATGTMLQAAGLKVGECPELVNIERPEIMKKIHKAYIDVGSTIVETNTFGASALKLAHFGLSSRAREINVAGAKIAREAVGENVKVAGSMGPTGRLIEPLGDLGFEEAYKCYYEQAAALAEGGVDYLIIETSIDIQEMRAALIAAKDATNLPVICQMSYSEDGRTVTGTDPATATVILDALGASIIGVNCSLGPKELLPVVETIAKNTDKPISVQPNAGLPMFYNGKTLYPMTPNDFAYYAPKLVAAGATYIGGCCGTTPEHIRAIVDSLKGIEPPERAKVPSMLRIASRSQVVTIDKTLSPVLIGERINPTGRKKMAAEIREGSLIMVKKEAVGQTKAGVSVLDVNMGAAGVDQTKMMRRAVKEISQMTPTPLSLDTSDAEALEAGLRIYPGRALINSVSFETERIEKFLPLAKKYGAAILCLPVTNEGVPKTADERISVMTKIIEAAKNAGLRDGDFLLDALVLTVAASPSSASETLKTLRLYREKFGYPSTMGLSNISFGLPNRPLVNRTFYAMCLAAGLDAPIMNPYDTNMIDTLVTSNALLGVDANGKQFSRIMSGRAEPNPKAPASAPVNENMTAIDKIKAAVIDGEKELIGELVESSIKDGAEPNDITENGLTAAMNDLGEDFGAGRIFLPEVLLSAEAMREGFKKLQEVAPAVASEKLGTVVLATVKGDVHDLGKNIVSALMKNSGFDVIDLGKDVPSEKIVEVAKEKHAEIVGLSALMTTTMTEIETVVKLMKNAGVSAKTIVGGAAVTEGYANEAGADYYAADGVTAVRQAKEIVKKN